MPRSDKDSWDLASSVGTTATMVATARALASKQPDPLIDDPFADPLVRAVGIDFFVRVLDGDVEIAAADTDPNYNLQRLINVMAVRTRFFDNFFMDASAAGLRQAVILAAGLDSRPYRLPWPVGTVVYEIDQPAVVEFKSTTLSALGAQPTATRRVIPTDLRDDWVSALRHNGFDDEKPTAWSAEGLLLYLPPKAQDSLFDAIGLLSAPGSRLATEYHPDGLPMLNDRAKAMTDRWAQFGLDMDLSSLVYGGERSPVTDYLTERGWHVSTRSRTELFTEAGLSVLPTDASQPLQNTVAVTAILPS
ncbi:class I SAM-dependent methyltransferase [Mycobacterium sp.]|uniref:class I SAM-dependent methyltransferase n=1 Tax=Mycobacterium sp. TaxID=1785 RepID=UPI003BAB93CB